MTPSGGSRRASGSSAAVFDDAGPDPAAPGLEPTVAETHLSVVMCIGDRAYKLKKALSFPFVDQSTREQRERLCQQEVERNRRLAPDVYLGVADITGPDGVVCDHLVVMRRMPADRRLSTLVAAGDPTVITGLQQLAGMVAAFHQSARRSSRIDAAASADALIGLWHANAVQLRPFEGTVVPHGAVDDTIELAERYVDHRRALLEARVADGWIRDGHGDLLASDIFLLDDGPRALDCLDFDERLAYGDVAADVAFLAMDLERLGHPELAHLWLVSYEHSSGATIPPSLLHLYIAYRAQVRAKVAALRSTQQPSGPAAAETRQLLVLCVDHLRLAIPRLVIVGGAPGTGKTTVARAISSERGWCLLRSDVQRKATTPGQPATAGAWEQGPYTPERTATNYRRLMAAARHDLTLGRSVVVDATFSTEDERDAARRLAADEGAELLELRCTLDPRERDRRILARRTEGSDASDADESLAARMAAAAEPWPGAIQVSTDGALEDLRDRVRQILDDWIAG